MNVVAWCNIKNECFVEDCLGAGEIFALGSPHAERDSLCSQLQSPAPREFVDILELVPTETGGPQAKNQRYELLTIHLLNVSSDG